MLLEDADWPTTHKTAWGQSETDMFITIGNNMYGFIARSEACHVMLPMHLVLPSLVDFRLLVASLKAAVESPFKHAPGTWPRQACGKEPILPGTLLRWRRM